MKLSAALASRTKRRLGLAVLAAVTVGTTISPPAALAAPVAAPAPFT